MAACPEFLVGLAENFSPFTLPSYICDHHIPTFYLPNKIQKPNNTHHPIISSYNFPTENVFAYVCSHLQPIVQSSLYYNKTTSIISLKSSVPFISSHPCYLNIRGRCYFPVQKYPTHAWPLCPREVPISLTVFPHFPCPSPTIFPSTPGITFRLTWPWNQNGPLLCESLHVKFKRTF